MTNYVGWFNIGESNVRELTGTKCVVLFIFLIGSHALYVNSSLDLHTGRCLRPMVWAWLKTWNFEQLQWPMDFTFFFSLVPFITHGFYCKHNFFSLAWNEAVFLFLCSHFVFMMFNHTMAAVLRSMNKVSVLYVMFDLCSGVRFHINEHMHHQYSYTSQPNTYIQLM